MEKNHLILIIVVLLLGIAGAYYIKYGQNNNSQTQPQNQQKSDWDKWPQNQPNQPNQPPAFPPEVKPDQPKPLQNPKSYQEAVSMAQASNTNVFLYFETNNCVYCKQMKSKTFSDPKVKERLSSCVIYYCNAGNEKNIASKYEVSGVPAYFLIDKNETVLKSERGFKTSDEFLGWLDGNQRKKDYKEEITSVE